MESLSQQSDKLRQNPFQEEGRALVENNQTFLTKAYPSLMAAAQHAFHPHSHHILVARATKVLKRTGR
jgi:hypothetical protein